MIGLSLALLASVSINILLIWYARKLTKQFLFFTENVGALEEALRGFDGHLRGVHEMEMFYGDDTLGLLIKHSKDLVDDIAGFYDSFSLDEEDEVEGEQIDGKS